MVVGGDRWLGLAVLLFQTFLSANSVLGLGLFAPPHAAETALVNFPTCGSVLEFISVGSGAVAARDLLARFVAENLEEDRHDDTASDADAKDSDHGEIAASVLMRPLDSICRPSSIQSICCCDTAEISKSRHKGGRGSHANLAVTLLKDLICPSHADGNSGSKSEADQEETAIPCPRIGQGKSDCEEACNLYAHRARKEQSPVFVEPVRNRGDQQDGAKVHLQLC